MKLKITYLFICLLFTFNANAQQYWNLSDSICTMGFELGNKDSTAIFQWWKIDDTNANDTTWEFYYRPTESVNVHSGDYSLLHQQVNEDWLFSPGMYLEASKQYEISFWYSMDNDNDDEDTDFHLILKSGYDSSNTAMTDTLSLVSYSENQEYFNVKIKYTVPVDSIYYFGWYTYGTPIYPTNTLYEWFYLFLDDITIKEWECDTLTTGITDNTGFCPGQNITLDAGSGFSSYKWNGNSSLNTQQLIVDTAGTYSVAITNSSGCSGTDNIIVSAYTSPDVNITSETGTDCYSASVVLNAGTGFSSYEWNGNTNDTEQYLSVYSLDTYYVEITDENGCSATDSILITNIPSLLSVNITTQNNSSCDSIDYLLDAGSGYLSYYWYYYDTLISHNQQVSVSKAGTYTVIVPDANWCTARDSVIITSFDISKVDIVMNDNSSCDSLNVTLNAGSGFSDYIWNGDTNLSNNQYLSVNTPGIYDVVVTDADGCIRTDTIIVSALVVEQVNISMSQLISCDSEGIRLDATTGFVSYTWNGPDGYISSLDSVRIYKAGTYNVIAVESNGCSRRDSIVIPDTSFVVFPDDTLVYSGNSSFCQGDSLIVMADITGKDNGSYTFQWSGGSYIMNTDTSIIITNAGNYSVLITDKSTGCSNSSNFITNVLTPYQYEEISVVTVDTTKGENKLLWDITAGYNTQAYFIYRSDNNGIDYKVIDTVDYSDAGVYVDETADPNQRSFGYKIAVLDSCGNTSVISNNHTTMYLVSYSEFEGVNKLLWSEYEGLYYNEYNIYRDGILIKKLDNYISTYTDLQGSSTNQYYIEIVYNDSLISLSNIASVEQDNFITDADINQEANLKIYPNPFKESTTIEYSLIKESDVLIEVYDIVGKKIATIVNENQNEGNYQSVFNGNEFGCSKGMYFLKIRINNTVGVEKLILE